MIQLLTGENSFEIERALQRTIAEFNGSVERVDGSELELARVPDLLMGGTLFADKRLVIIKNLSDNTSIWAALPEWLPRIADEISVVLVESKPDKRTKTFKELQKVADIKEYKAWSDRDTFAAEQWAAIEAKARGFTLDKKSAHLLVDRVGVNQWMLSHALDKLAVMDTVSLAIIEEVIEANPVENVFDLLDAALRGNGQKVRDMIKTLELSEDPYRVFGLLTSQVFQLAALSATDKPTADIAKDIGAHPYALGKLAPHAEHLEIRC